VVNSAAVTAVHTGMGTEMDHRVFGRHAIQALEAVTDEAQRLERLFSRFRPESDISRINRAAGVRRESVSSETYEVLSRSVEFSVISQGLFDITVGPLADLWDYRHATEPPAGDRIESILPLVGYGDLELDAVRQAAGLKHPGRSLDLGGIGKGFASDRFMEIFRQHGVTSAFSNLGGNVSTLGSKPDGAPWQVGIRHPRRNGLIGAVSVTGKSVVTSGDYERYFLGPAGRRFHHLLNPLTGHPAESGLISATVVADSALLADALSTAVFVAGPARGLALLEKFPPVDAVLVDTELRTYVTRGLRQCFRASAAIDISYV